MREILFRGECIESGKWVFGSFVKGGMTVNNNIPNSTIAAYGCYPEEVVPETVGQYTGLKDRNGKMIFEGDELIYGANEVGTVSFKDGCFNVEGFYCGSQDYPSMAFSECASFEIIGTIHDKQGE